MKGWIKTTALKTAVLIEFTAKSGEIQPVIIEYNALFSTVETEDFLRFVWEMARCIMYAVNFNKDFVSELTSTQHQRAARTMLEWTFVRTLVQ